ncbi:MAG: hypothetical protein ACK56I_08825 [bacterium]
MGMVGLNTNLFLRFLIIGAFLLLHVASSTTHAPITTARPPSSWT